MPRGIGPQLLNEQQHRLVAQRAHVHRIADPKRPAVDGGAVVQGGIRVTGRLTCGRGVRVKDEGRVEHLRVG